MTALTTWQPRLVLMYGQHFCLFCCNTEATFCTVDQDCQPDRENGKEIPTLLIRINKVVSRINKVVSRINKLVSRIVEGVDPNQQGGTPNQQSVSRILYGESCIIPIQAVCPPPSYQSDGRAVCHCTAFYSPTAIRCTAF